jgi:hypothetical protein
MLRSSPRTPAPRGYILAMPENRSKLLLIDPATGKTAHRLALRDAVGAVPSVTPGKAIVYGNGKGGRAIFLLDARTRTF